VDEGRALEDRWREELPVPRGGPHHASAVFGDRLYVFGGEEGDVKPVAGDPRYTCDWNTPLEITLSDTFMLETKAQHWHQMSPMPEGRAHTEYAIVKIGPYAVVVGGIAERYKYSDLIQVYDTQTDRWRAAGRLPYVMKTAAVYHEGWLFTVTGQRGTTITDPRPGKVLNSVWRTKFSVGQTADT
jgi:N-acetylneuraminic acid mutarotase